MSNRRNVSNGSHALNDEWSREFCTQLNLSGYIRGVARFATNPTHHTLWDLAYETLNRDEGQLMVLMQYTIIRIGLVDEDQVQIVTRERVPSFDGEDIPLREGRYRAILLQYDEVVELPFHVEENGELQIDANYMSMEDQFENEMRHNVGPTMPAVLTGTVVENPASTPTDDDLIHIINLWCIRTGEFNSLEIDSIHSSEESTGP